jgi:uncharacterized protein
LIYASNQAQESPVRPIPMMAMKSFSERAAVAPLAISSRKVEESATVYAVFAIE